MSKIITSRRSKAWGKLKPQACVSLTYSRMHAADMYFTMEINIRRPKYNSLKAQQHHRSHINC